MTISVSDIASASSTAGTTIVATVPVGGVPSGALIVVGVVEKNSSVGGSVTDSKGNTYTLAKGLLYNSSADFGAIFYSPNAIALVSGDSITFTKAASGDTTAIDAIYATGILASSPLDTAVTASASGSSTSPLVTSGTPAMAGELLVALCAWDGNNSDTYSQAAGFASPFVRVNASATNHRPIMCGGYEVNAGSAAQTFAPTITSNAWAAIIAGFKPAIAASVVPILRPHGPNSMRHLRR